MLALVDLPSRDKPDPDAEVIAEIQRLKRDLNAVILAHYYQEDDIQDIADFVGDSLELSRRACQTNAETIVFCGVHFMAETAKILNPDKRVLLPDLDAGCSLADRCPPDEFRRWVDAHPGHAVVTYINSSAAVKALSDVICTSSNAPDVVRSLPPDQPVLFAPDRHLGRWVAKQTGRELKLWPGFCIVHEQFSLRRIVQLRARHVGALLIAHPECEEEVLAQANFIGSTSALLRYVETSPAKSFIVATEAGLLHSMRRRRPDATLIAAAPNSGCDCALCPYMRLNTLEKIARCMGQRRPEITVEGEIATRARRALERMLAVSPPPRSQS